MLMPNVARVCNLGYPTELSSTGPSHIVRLKFWCTSLSNTENYMCLLCPSFLE